MISDTLQEAYMSDVINMKDYTQKQVKRPREITFFSPRYRTKEGLDASLVITFRVEDGSIGAVLDGVKENGGIGQTNDNGVYQFIPWPCAVMEIRDV
jgi:hypothetical protein